MGSRRKREKRPEGPPPIQLPRLYDWQDEALVAWSQAGHRGIVEAVTGSGKTCVAMAALAQLYAKEKQFLQPLIVVPTVDLMNQWYRELLRAFPGRKIGRLGATHKDDFSTLCFACVAVVNSAVKRLLDLMGHCNGGKLKSFLIADECHHYTDAPVFQKIRKWPFDYVLGLSATIEPYDIGGLGKIVYSYGFSDARRHDLVPPFDLVNIAVDFTSPERDRYNDLSTYIGELFDVVGKRFAQEIKSRP